jgi:alkanesulfonate monooxygenase SsuD/methylene tetrahydromethanopterin reductase-like flavin-dependent oxidoreductase (luciferase family)
VDADPAAGELALREIDEQVAAAAAAGFAGVWMPEHHAASRYFPPPFQLLTWLAARHPRIYVGTNVALTPLFHPLHLAEAIATLDWLTGGRAVVGLGAGFRPAEFDAFGVDVDARFQLSREIVPVVRRLLDGERVNFEIGPWRGREASVSVRTGRRPPILWAAMNSMGVRTAQRLGADGLLPNPMGGFRSQLDLLDEFDALRGSRAEWRPLVADLVLGDTADEARRRAVRSLGAEYSSFKHWRSLVESLDAFARDPEAAVDSLGDRALVGTIDQVAAKIDALAAAGVTDLAVRARVADTPHEEVLEAVTALGALAARPLGTN